MMTGIILAGGLNRRMGGRPKALLPVQGEVILQRQIKEMSRWCGQVIVVTNEPEILQPTLASVLECEVQCIRDVYPHKGPLSGMHAASRATRTPYLWIVGCDMPFISGEAAEAMLEVCRVRNVDAIIPELDGRLQPLHGIYAIGVGAEAELHLQQGRFRLMGLLDHLDWQPVQADFFEARSLRTNFTTNVNTPEEYEVMLGNLSL